MLSARPPVRRCPCRRPASRRRCRHGAHESCQQGCRRPPRDHPPLRCACVALRCAGRALAGARKGRSLRDGRDVITPRHSRRELWSGWGLDFTNDKGDVEGCVTSAGRRRLCHHRITWQESATAVPSPWLPALAPRYSRVLPQCGKRRNWTRDLAPLPPSRTTCRQTPRHAYTLFDVHRFSWGRQLRRCALQLGSRVHSSVGELSRLQGGTFSFVTAVVA